MTEPIDLPAALARIDEPWSPRTGAVLNDDDIQVVKTKGESTRHRHLETDEVFLVAQRLAVHQDRPLRARHRLIARPFVVDTDEFHR